MHPMRNFSRPSNALLDEEEIKAHKRRAKTRKQRLQTANQVFEFARSDGFKILVEDVKSELTRIQERIFGNASINVKQLEALRFEAQAWKKVLKKLNGYFQEKDLIQKAMKREAEAKL